LENFAKLSKSQNWPKMFLKKKKKTVLLFMEKHQTISLFFQMIRGKKVYAYKRQQFLYHMSKKELSSMSSFSSTKSPKT
jgi:hypothetical protein